MIRILAYQGKSWVSKAIRWQTRSQYSHIALLMPDDTVIEAWHIGGVQRVPSFIDNHTPGTKVDVYKLRKESLPIGVGETIANFLQNQVGQPYDFRAIVRFLTRRPYSANKKWFCSELCAEAFRIGGIPLQDKPTYELSPRDIAMSPLLMKTSTWTC